jgi:hypothetical protein
MGTLVKRSVREFTPRIFASAHRSVQERRIEMDAIGRFIVRPEMRLNALPRLGIRVTPEHGSSREPFVEALLHLVACGSRPQVRDLG